MATDPLRIISIGAHPADVFDQSGGTMAHHAARGDHVSCVVLTHGARVHDKVISDAMFHREEVPGEAELSAMMAERSQVKAQEVRAACGILGFEDVHFFDVDDSVLMVTEGVVKRLARLIRKLRPDVVLTHFPKEKDGLVDPHAVGGQIAIYAIQVAAGVDPGDPNPPGIRGASVLLRHRGGQPATNRLGGPGWLLQRRLHRHHGRGRQEAGRAGLPGEPGV